MSESNGGGWRESPPTDWTVKSRALHLIAESERGLTTAELYPDPVLSQYSRSAVSEAAGLLHKLGKIEPSGQRGRFIVWRVVETEPDAPSLAEAKLLARAEKIVADLKRPEVLAMCRAVVTTAKEHRRVEEVVRVLQRDEEAAQLAEEKRKARADKEALKLADARRDSSLNTMTFGIDTAKRVDAMADGLGIVVRESDRFDLLARIKPSQIQMIDRARRRLDDVLHIFDLRLHPQGHATNAMAKGDIIDVG